MLSSVQMLCKNCSDIISSSHILGSDANRERTFINLSSSIDPRRSSSDKLLQNAYSEVIKHRSMCCINVCFLRLSSFLYVILVCYLFFCDLNLNSLHLLSTAVKVQIGELLHFCFSQLLIFFSFRVNTIARSN